MINLRKRRLIPLILSSAPLLTLPACSHTPERASDTREPTSLTLSDFADDTVVVQRPEPAVTNATSVTPTTPLVTGVGTPSASTGPGTGERLTVDLVVGQINGAPVYAEQFYRASEDRWREQSKRESPQEWSKNLREFTELELYNRLREELLLAEFRASLTEQQRLGVLNFVEQIRKGRISAAGGSIQEAELRALEEQGVDLTTAVQSEAEGAFILQQLRNTIVQRVQVSSRDIEFYYNRNIREYQPLPVAVIRQAGTSADNQERIAEINALFASSDTAQEVGTVSRITLDENGQSQTQFFQADALNTPAQSLRVGEVVGPIQVNNRVWWLRLDAIETAPQRSLYDVQLDIEQLIRQQRLQEEESRYFERLLERSNVSDINDMLSKLMNYAIERFYVPDDEG